MSAPSGLDSGVTTGGRHHDAEDTHGPRGLLQRIGSITALYTVAVFAVEVAFFAIRERDRFLTTDNLILTAQNVAVLTVVACGATFVLITAGVDLSVGSVAILGEVVAAKTIINAGGSGTVDALFGIGAAIGVGILVGIINGIGVAYLKVPPLIVTLGTMLAGLSAAQIITDGVNVPNRTLNALGNDRVGGVPYIVLVGLGVVVVTGILLHFTVFGRHTYAIGSNAEAARRVGINVPGHLVKVYALAGALSGFGGLLSLARFNTTSIGGHQSDPLEAIAAAALGGTSVFGGIGSILGTVVGVWIPGVLRNGIIIIGVQPYWQGIIIGLVLIGTVWFDQYRRRAAAGGTTRRYRIGRLASRSLTTNPPTNHQQGEP
jgi:ribose transport system permease protein